MRAWRSRECCRTLHVRSCFCLGYITLALLHASVRLKLKENKWRKQQTDVHWSHQHFCSTKFLCPYADEHQHRRTFTPLQEVSVRLFWGGSRSCATRVKDVKISCCPKTPAGAAGQNRLLLELLKLQQPILYLLYIILQKDTFRLRELFILQLTLQNDVYASMVMYLFKWIELISIDFD